MTIRDDRAYFMMRAQIERAKADVCTDVGIAETHRRMAQAYEQRIAEMPTNVHAIRNEATAKSSGTG